MKKYFNKVKFISFFSTLLIIASLLGCNQVKHPISKTGLYFDTVISITLYEANSSKLIDDCFQLANKYENLLSKTVASSDISRINNSYNEWIKVDPKTLEVIKTGLEYEDLSEGRFSIVCGSITDLWDIAKSNNEIPNNEEISNALLLCGHKNIEVDDENSAIRIINKGAKLDLGAVAKGFIADEMKEYLISNGVESGIIQLGGNVLLIGHNPIKDDGLYTIGINKPFSSDGDVITAVSEKDDSIVTSGNYQRYFEYNGKKYHHIIDLYTGYPVESGLNSVTIICDKSIDADCLSTVCFLYGYDKSNKLISQLNSQIFVDKPVSAIFIDSDNNIL